MLRGLYQVADAMERVSRNHEVVAENLVNATTPGYRRRGTLFEAAETSFAPADAPVSARQARHTAPTATSFSYFDPGSLQQTSNSLDFALSGDAFFTVDGPDGPLYTRNGTFQIGPDGTLVTRGGGYRLRGPINISRDASTITITPDGVVTANGNTVGRLQLARFENPQTLRRVGPTLFEGDAPQTPQPGAVRVQQGYVESSNVQPVQEMVSMMMGLRFYEAAQKAMQSLSDAIAQNTRPQQS